MNIKSVSRSDSSEEGGLEKMLCNILACIIFGKRIFVLSRKKNITAIGRKNIFFKSGWGRAEFTWSLPGYGPDKYHKQEKIKFILLTSQEN